MLSAVARYKQLLSSALARYFPHTTAYLRAEREAAQPRKPVRKQSKKNPLATRKPAVARLTAVNPALQGFTPAPG